MNDPLTPLVRFSTALRDHGVPVSPAQSLTFCEAAAHLDPADLYWAGRATLTTAREHIPVYDRVFHAFWSSGAPPRERQSFERPLSMLVDAPDEGSENGQPPDLAAGSVRASSLDGIREKHFAELTAAEFADVARAIQRMRITTPMRRSRRMRPSRRGDLDLRRMTRLASRTAGEPMRRAWRRPVHKRRRVVFILDVSASMAEYSRALLLFAHAGLRAHPSWTVFCFSTRPSQISQPLLASDPNAALAEATAKVDDWDTGTRIGESLKEILTVHRDRGLVRGAVVVVCSDGFDVGDPVVLAAQMERLAALSHQLVWVNPLHGMDGYAPLAQGMQAAMPHIDRFVSGRNFASLEDLADLFAGL